MMNTALQQGIPHVFGLNGVLMEVVTNFLGVLIEVGSLMFGLFILRFEMQLLLLSLGKAFGK